MKFFIVRRGFLRYFVFAASRWQAVEVAKRCVWFPTLLRWSAEETDAPAWLGYTPSFTCRAFPPRPPRRPFALLVEVDLHESAKK
jgi:hypothetical protein